MFVGYVTGHLGDCFWMYDPKMDLIWMMHDVIWLKRMFYINPPHHEQFQANPIFLENANSSHGSCGPDHGGGNCVAVKEEDDPKHNNKADDDPNAVLDCRVADQHEDATVPPGDVQVPLMITMMMNQLAIHGWGVR